MKLSHAALSHPGLRRLLNEDSYCVRPDLGLFVVADGMGGHAAGEVASRLAVESIEAFVEASVHADESWTWPFGFDPALGIDGTRLKSALRLANQHIASRAADDPEVRGMATTVAAVLVGSEMLEQGSGSTLPAIVAHVGDSRVYLFRLRSLERLTRDHSWVEEQISAGTLSVAAARDHPWRNLVTRALTGGGDPDADLVPLALERGDRLLICSDGLTVVPDDRLAALMAPVGPAAEPRAVSEALVTAANDRGGPDNVTAIVIDVVSLD